MSFGSMLVVTTSSLDGIKIQKYLQPISATVGVGVNVINDFFGAITDFFDGRSTLLENIFDNLHNDVLDKLKIAAFEVGANCIIGLNIDTEELSGNGTSMFLVRATGTAVVADIAVQQNTHPTSLKYVRASKIVNLQIRKDYLAQAAQNKLVMKKEVWDFITQNEVQELLPYTLKNLLEVKEYHSKEEFKQYYTHFLRYMMSLPEDLQKETLYKAIRDERLEHVLEQFVSVIKDRELYDYHKCVALITSGDFYNSKKGLRISVYDKAFYNAEDALDIKRLISIIHSSFPERGTRTVKKQLLSKDKEAWNCTCGKVNV